VILGQSPGQAPRGWVQGIDGGPPHAFTPPLVGVNISRVANLPVSPDGTRVAAQGVDSVPTIFRISDGASEPVPGTLAGEAPVQWSDDGRALFVTRSDGQPVVDRVDLATGRRTRALEIPARDRIGLRISMVQISPNGKYYVHSYSRLLTDLFVVEGLR
jgi:hypothetical protein